MLNSGKLLTEEGVRAHGCMLLVAELQSVVAVAVVVVHCCSSCSMLHQPVRNAMKATLQSVRS